MMPKSILIIINPASGSDKPILRTLSKLFHETDANWDVRVTRRGGDAYQYAYQFAQSGGEVVAVYGGDGTVMETASGLIGSQTRLAILPGGTANVMSLELGIPGDFGQACALLDDECNEVRVVDMAEIRPETGDKPHYFMLRAGLGFEADVVEAANREMKEKLGSLAYLASGISKLRDAKVSNYQLRIDGERIDTDGICCFIANSASLGQGGFMLVPEVDVSDGLLDVIVVRKADAGAILNVAANVLRGNENPDLMPRWKGRDIHIVAEPAQNLQADGEIIGQSPVQVRAIPGAVRVLIPKPAAPAAPTDAATKQGEKSPS